MAFKRIQGIPRRTQFILLLIIIVSFAAGMIAARFIPIAISSNPNPAFSRIPVRLGPTGLTNSLLYITDGTTPSAQLRGLQDVIQKAIDQDEKNNLISDAGVYFHDFTLSQWTGVNKDHLFSPASLLKVPIMIAYLKVAETSPNILQDQLYYDGSFDDNLAENIKPLKEIEKGRSYSANDLLIFMMYYSDNNAMDLLIKHIGMDAVNEVYTDMHVPIATSTIDYLTPQAYSRFFRVLYSATYLNNTMSEKALELLTYPDFPQGIRAGLPENAIVADKFGERSFGEQEGADKELHDCGIVYYPQNPYFLCIMTKGSNFIGMENTLQDISHRVWQQVSGSN